MRAQGRRGVCLFEVPGLPAWSGKKKPPNIGPAAAGDSLDLESELQTKLDLPLCTDTVHAGAITHPERLVICLRGAVNRTTSRAEQQTVHRVRGQVEIGKIEQVVEAHARLESDSFCERMPPSQSEIERAQPGKVYLAAWRIR